MSVFKNSENGSWFVMTRYTNWKGERKQKCKRGFATKREAQEWEQKFHQQTSGDMDMTFAAFVEIYTADLKPRLKENTWLTKGTHYSEEAPSLFWGAENQRDHHKGCDCLAK